MGLTDKLRAVTEDSRKAAQEAPKQEQVEEKEPKPEQPSPPTTIRAGEEGGAPTSEPQKEETPAKQPEESGFQSPEAKELEELRKQLERVKAKRRRAKKAVTMHIPVIMADAIDEVYRMTDIVKGEMAIEAWDAYLTKKADELESFEWPPPDGFQE